jgi:hypothetical protein
VTEITFFYPQALYALLLAVPIMLLYSRKASRPRHVVATSMLWRQVLPLDNRKDWRGPMSLAVQLAILALLVLALADPRAKPTAKQTPSSPQATASQTSLNQEDAAVQAIAGIGLVDITPAVPWSVRWFGALAIVILTVEWCLYQRCWMT